MSDLTLVPSNHVLGTARQMHKLAMSMHPKKSPPCISIMNSGSHIQAQLIQPQIFQASRDVPRSEIGVSWAFTFAELCSDFGLYQANRVKFGTTGSNRNLQVQSDAWQASEVPESLRWSSVVGESTSAKLCCGSNQKPKLA